MDGTLASLARLRRFAQAMAPTVPKIDLALPASRALLKDAAARFKYVGGIAVVHHGYLRTTQDIDILVEASSIPSIVDHACAHGFSVESHHRLRHVYSDVALDLLIAGEPMPRPGAPAYPAPDDLEASSDDPSVVALAPLCMLKLRAHRHQDLADVVALLGRLDEGHYLQVEASTPSDLRAELATLRDDALAERAQADSQR
jgi:hypothetical protein